MPTAPRAERFDCLDALRGFAILGILMVNIQLFAMVWAAADVPTLHTDFTAFGNRAVWVITQTAFSWKFHILFGAMFGAGIVLMHEGHDLTSHTRHQRRMAWLLLFGLVHAYVFWFGDILVPYALAGMLLVPARNMSVRGLITLGLGLYALTGLAAVGVYAMGGLTGDTMTMGQLLGFQADEVPRIEALYQAGFVDRLGYNFLTALISQLFQIVFAGGRIAGAILLGMAACKMGFIALRWPVRHYAIGAAAGIGFGWLLCGWSAAHMLGTDFAPSTAWEGMLAQYVGSLITVVGYACAVMLAAQQSVLAPVIRALAATGRMAFSNYLLQTLILTLIFVGPPGLGLFGEVERTGQALIVIVMWAVQIGWSMVWLKHFHYGPMEWAWRSLTYSQAQPFRRDLTGS